MAVTNPPQITPPPAAPQRKIKAVFADQMDAFLTWLILAVSQFRDVAANVAGNALDAFNNATAAAQSALQAAASATAAAASSSAQKWVAGLFNDGVVVWSPSDYLPYRKKGSGNSAVDPAADNSGAWAPQMYTPGLRALKFTSSQVWSPPYDCWAEVIVQGGGASGPISANSTAGGPGGGTAIKWLRLYASVSYTITVGAGGAPQTGSMGQAGGTSSVSGSGITTIIANGGPSVWVSGGVGGSASGGDINITGGSACNGTNNYDSSYPSGASYFSPGGTMPNTDGVNFGAGAGNTYGATVSKAGFQGVVVIRY